MAEQPFRIPLQFEGDRLRLGKIVLGFKIVLGKIVLGKIVLGKIALGKIALGKIALGLTKSKTIANPGRGSDAAARSRSLGHRAMPVRR
jgi:hypothetical protein